MITLLVVLFGSPFELGGLFNPEVPRIKVSNEFSSVNHQYGNGNYVTILYVESLGQQDSEVVTYLVPIDNSGKPLMILNSIKHDSVTRLFLSGGKTKALAVTTDVRPSHFVFCSKAWAHNGRTMSEYVAVRSLLDLDPQANETLYYREENQSVFSQFVMVCQSKLSLENFSSY